MMVVVDNIFPVEYIVFVNVFKVDSFIMFGALFSLGGFCQRVICLD
jgi:hypothetical protein